MNIEQFLTIFTQQNEPGLYISQEEPVLDGFRVVALDFNILGSELKKSDNIAVQITPEGFTKEIYSMIKQYTDRDGALQIPINGVWAQAQINTDTTKLLLCATPQTMIEIEKEYPLRSIVGMVFENK